VKEMENPVQQFYY